MNLSRTMLRALRFSTFDPAQRRGRISGARRVTWEALEKRGYVEFPGRFGTCWSVTDAGAAYLVRIDGPTVNAPGGAS